MVGVPMLKAERVSRSDPKLSDAQTRNFEAIKYSKCPTVPHLPQTGRWGTFMLAQCFLYKPISHSLALPAPSKPPAMSLFL